MYKKISDIPETGILSQSLDRSSRHLDTKEITERLERGLRDKIFDPGAEGYGSIENEREALKLELKNIQDRLDKLDFLAEAKEFMAKWGRFFPKQKETAQECQDVWDNRGA